MSQGCISRWTTDPPQESPRDLRGLLTSGTDALGNTTTFTYDAKGNLHTTTDPLGHTTTLEYDAAGNVRTSTDALGRETTFAYDALNRLTCKFSLSMRHFFSVILT